MTLTTLVATIALTLSTAAGGDIANQPANSFTLTIIITVEGEYTLSLVNPGGQASNAVSLSVRGLAVGR